MTDSQIDSGVVASCILHGDCTNKLLGFSCFIKRKYQLREQLDLLSIETLSHFQ